MKFGIFYEHQLPRPWGEDSEQRLINDALEQIELADKLGIQYLWEVEHHFLEEYSHSSAPEVFLAAASLSRVTAGDEVGGTRRQHRPGPSRPGARTHVPVLLAHRYGSGPRGPICGGESC